MGRYILYHVLRRSCATEQKEGKQIVLDGGEQAACLRGMTNQPEGFAEYMREIAAKGGKNGKGKSKARDAAHYARIVELSLASRGLKRKEAKKSATQAASA